MAARGEKEGRQMRAGFLTYDLQPFTEDCLWRISSSIEPLRLKAYPMLYHPHQERARIAYRPSFLKGRFFGVRKEGSTPEGLTASVNWKAAWACASENDAVVLFGIQGGTALLAVIVSRLLGKRLMSVNQTLPAYRERRRRWWVRGVKGWILRRCHVHIYQTPATLDVLTTVYGLPEESLVYAPFEAGATIFKKLISEVREDKTALRKRFHWNDERVFIFSGTLLHFKGIDTILEAVKILKGSAAHSFRVVFYGPEGSQAGEQTVDEFRALAKRLMIDDVAMFMGQLSPGELASAYLAADALLLPTRRDMWPKVLVEAALAGLPLVTTTACGAAGALVIDAETGYVVDPDDPAALAGAMSKLFDPVVCKRLGTSARKVCIELCDPVKESSGYAAALRKLLNEPA